MPQPHQIVADIGGGLGVDGLAAIRHIADAMCLWIDRLETLEAARVRAAEIGVADRTTFIVGSSQDLNLDDDSVHIGYVTPSSDPADEEESADLLAKLRRIVLPGGAVVIRAGKSEQAPVSWLSAAESAGFEDVSVLADGGLLMRRPPLAGENAA
jgi:ubiquinone/menaquinone biosynthesis C-methylase UbiE